MLNNERELLDYLSRKHNINYTKDQEKALLHENSNLLLLAAPGSGKTTVVVGRIGSLIINKNVNPESILALTFSRASARDMENRFIKLFGNLIKEKPRFSTIHSFSMMIINEYSLKKNIKFKLIEDNKSNINKQNIIKQCYKNINNDYLPEDKLEDLLSSIGYVKNMMLKEDEIKELKTGVKGFSQIYKEYEDIKRKYKYIDYDDMLTYGLSILNSDEEILNKYREKFEYIICDEAQDTSKVQHAIIWLLGKGKNTMFFVADDDQCIYRFRGSYPSILKQFNKIYSNTKELYLERNFRSSKNIVSLTNKFIKSNKDRYDKNIYTEKGIGENVEIVKLNNEFDELEFIVNEIQDSSGSIGILYRNNISAIPIVNKLNAHNMSFFIRDNKMGFFKHWILEDFKAFFILSSDETNLDAFERIYYKTDNYISRSMIEYLRKNYIKDESVFSQLLKCPFIEPYNEKSLINFKYSLKNIKEKSPYFAIDYILNDMKYLDYLNSSKDEDNKHSNLKDITSILKTISVDAKNFTDVFNIIEDIKLSIDKAKFNSKSNITLTTIHSAKGLEYDRVYIIDACEGVFPSFESIDEEKKGNTSLIEEERRLFYVAMTRAKKTLKIIGTREKNSKALCTSRFIKEVNGILFPYKKRESSNEISIGDAVIHRAFGRGTVMYIEEDSIEINFLKLGQKKLLLSVCLEGGILTKD